MLRRARYAKCVSNLIARSSSRGVPVQLRASVTGASLQKVVKSIVTSQKMAGGPSTSGVSKELWHDSLNLAFQSLHSPFVNSLAHGTLRRCVVLRI
jgi:hypothetical protein